MTTYASDGSTQTTPDTDPAPAILDAETDESAPLESDGTGAEPVPQELEVVEADTLPAVRDTAAAAAVDAGAEPKPKWVHPEGWHYDWLEFKGDRLAVRVPNGAALVALQFAKYRSEDAQEAAFGRFIARHVSDATFDRVLDRMSDPDDTEYAETTILGELAGLLGKIAGERLKKDAEALEAAKNGQARKGNR